MKKILVVGNGMVGYKFCEKFVETAPSASFQLTVIGAEPHCAYDRVHLSEYFGGKSVEDLSMAPQDWYADQGISLHTGELVTEIDRNKKIVFTHRKNQYEYDILVLATGSVPFVPPIPGTDKKGVFVYRTIEDLDGIISYGKYLKEQGKLQAGVLGGGLLGLEAAKAVMDMELLPHVIELAPRLMPRQLDTTGAGLLKDTIQELGIEVHLGKMSTEILGEEHISGLSFKDGTSLPLDMLVISAGIRPRDELAKKAELAIGPRGGIEVNEFMQTSDPSIYAIGESALYQQKIYGLVAPGYEMAQVALNHILGDPTPMAAEVDMSAKLKLIGVDVASFGDALTEDEGVKQITFEDKLAGVYKRINVSVDGKKLLGGVLVGEAEDYNMLLQIAKNGLALPPKPEDLILGARGGGEEGGNSVMDLPDEAVICSCENVTKGSICSAITSGSCHDLKGVAKLTKANTGCGGCKPMVKDLINGSLASMGKTVKPTICPHFPYTRRELYDMIKVKGITTYNQALDEIGHGDGCETCKPALASIFASMYNEIATVQEMIQDTNDRYLANIQRNGTYSVVPRIPGGEITPEKLIVIGQVAQKYNLYTKITGGQRIDLFGARVDQLPDIWEELIAAGFESGHAYGKALRTVKSCVGSTWCRFGMDESVSFAVELENRYKGIRSPHKLKGGVSGCIRECAEARCKDFGVIATESGWNVYVAGNGGAKPKHALLLAEGVDKETCISYLDRYLMFYLKTAAPLTRTAAWLEKLEGGMGYLKQVVIEDRLGIAEDLENEMKLLVDTYKCEWKEVVENPELRKRFKHFVNSDEQDDNITFIPMRDQKMPKKWA
ncbi:MAG: nitrite reductase large subunit NirB [Bacteroidota bacterium]